LDVFAVIEAGDAERLRDLVEHDETQAAARDEQGVSAVMRARYLGRMDLVEPLVQAGPELDVFEAAALGATERLRDLLDREPALVGAWSADGGQPLHFAAFFANPEAARVLVDRGADVNAVARGFNNVAPLHSAAAGGSREICLMLMERGSDVNARQQGGFTALHAAAQNADGELVRALLAAGADAAAATDDGKTARDYAEGKADVLALL
jgi:ankyrin repeat protein